MQNNESGTAQVLNTIEPKTKSARIRAMHGLIESKLQDGVQIAQIVEGLRASGLDINVATLKSYLYRIRHKDRSPLPHPTPVQGASEEATGLPLAENPLSIHEIDSIINQDPASQAQDLLRYERLAKSNRRNT